MNTEFVRRPEERRPLEGPKHRW